MFSDRIIVQPHRAAQKMVYVLNYGLFYENLLAQVKGSLCFSGYFNESTNRVTKQIVRFLPYNQAYNDTILECNVLWAY
jgi:hypothetical protein